MFRKLSVRARTLCRDGGDDSLERQFFHESIQETGFHQLRGRLGGSAPGAQLFLVGAAIKLQGGAP